MRSLRSPLLPRTLVAPAAGLSGDSAGLPEPIAWLCTSPKGKGSLRDGATGLAEIGEGLFRMVGQLFSPAKTVDDSPETPSTPEDPEAASLISSHSGEASWVAAEEVPAVQGRSTGLATVLVILKAFVGGTMLVLPGSMQRTGLLAGNMTLWIVGLLELWCMLKLIDVHRRFGGTFGQLAERAMGACGSAAVETSILLSQLGFTAAEMIYVAKSGTFALEWAARHSTRVASWFGGMPDEDMEHALLWLQLLIVVPVSWCRDLSALTLFNFLGNALILGAVGAISAVTVEGIAHKGVAEEIRWGSPLQQVLVFTGFSVYAFEGITMVIPIYTAHKHKESFGRVLSWTIVGITALFSVFASANAVLFGDGVQPILTKNLPTAHSMRIWISTAFALGSLTLVFLMAFPTYEIIESKLRGSCGLKLSSAPSVGTLRALIVCLCAVVARFGGQRLDVFLSLVGAVGCVPLAFVYPGAIHLRLAAQGQLQAAGDVAVILIGLGITTSCLAGAIQ